VGGGIATLEDIKLVFEAGADKISMNSAAVRIQIDKAISKTFGSEKITIVLDARRNKEMPYFELVVSGGTAQARMLLPGQDNVRNWEPG
jgi:cyclase